MERPLLLTFDNAGEMDEDRRAKLYEWLDTIPLTRPNPKKRPDVARDFSDGVMAAELIKYFFPNYVDLHNYTPANNTNNKERNWVTLNKKPLRRLGIEVSIDTIRAIAKAKKFVVEHVLSTLRDRIDLHIAQSMTNSQANRSKPQLPPTQQQHPQHNDQPEADQQHRGHPSSGTSGYPDYPYQTRHNQYGIGSSALPQPSPYDELVPKEQLLEQEEKLRQSAVTIQLLNEKIEKLEGLIHLRDIQVEELNEKLRQPSPSKQDTKPKATKGTTQHGGRK